VKTVQEKTTNGVGFGHKPLFNGDAMKIQNSRGTKKGLERGKKARQFIN